MSKITRELPELGEKLPFKMIFYNADKKLPKMHRARWHAKRHSNKVLVLVAFKSFKATYDYRFAVYIKDYKWQIEGMSGDVHVAAWAYIPNKMKQLFNSL